MKFLNTLRLKRAELFVCLLLIAATLAVYWPMWNQDFINLDDDIYVSENRQLQEGLTLKGVVWAFTDTSQVLLWLPLTWLSLMLDYDLYGLSAGGYKITNLIFHLANSLLLLLLLKQLTGKLWRSAFVAAMFALHPLHVESVAWVTERKDVLSTLFWMLTMLAYLHYVERPGIRRYLLVLFTFALGLMAKPMLVTLPFALLLLDYWPLNRFHLLPATRDGEPDQPLSPVAIKANSPGLKLALEKLPLIFLALGASVVTFLAQLNKGSATAVSSLELIPIKIRLANGLVSYVSYIGKTLWPQNLGVLYPHPGGNLPMWQAAMAAALLVAISWLILAAYRRRPYLLTGWLWYLGTLLPVIGLVQVGPQAMADRFTYVPGIGLFIILAWGSTDLLSGQRHGRRALALLASVTIVSAIVLSGSQVKLWKNGRTLYGHTLSVTSHNWLIQNNLGMTLLAEEKFAEAITPFTEALKILPDYTEAHNNLGFALLERGKTREAAEHFSEALRIKPDYAEAHNNLGYALAIQGKTQEAVAHYSEALRLKPDYAQAHNTYGMALAEMGKTQEAAEQFSEAIRLKPDYAQAHNNLGLSLKMANRLNEAFAQFTKAVQLKPDYAEAHNNLGILLTMQGRLQEAVPHFSAALKSEPDSATAHNSLGIALAQQGKLPEAVTKFSETLKLDPNNAEAANNLKTALELLKKPN
ncbi:MAG: tetratricopeptide repeat protein [Desulfobulbaceae bacterium]|nr:tetratricopeptide repeat protein [Desulfobulbaceae bacterium]